MGCGVLAVTAVVARTMGVMQIAFVLYDKFTALDIIGPFQTLVDVPGVESVFVAESARPGRWTTPAPLAHRPRRRSTR